MSDGDDARRPEVDDLGPIDGVPRGRPIAAMVIGAIALVVALGVVLFLLRGRIFGRSSSDILHFVRIKKEGSELHLSSAKGGSRGLCKETFEFWAGHPLPSPDGRRVAYLDDDRKLLVMNIDCTGRRVLAEHEGATILYAAWSRDGSKIAYVAAFRQPRHGHVEVPTIDHHYLAGLDAPPRDLGIFPHGSTARFSADGETLLHAEVTYGKEEWSGSGDRVREVKGEVVAIARGVRKVVVNEPNEVADPAFSPDDQRIVYAARRDGVAALLLVDPSGANTRAIFSANNPSFERERSASRLEFRRPHFSPDGALIAFEVSNGRSYVITTAGNVETDLEGRCPAFSSDGAFVVTFSDSNGSDGKLLSAPMRGPAVTVGPASGCASFVP